MPEQVTLKRARKDKRAGKAPSTQAGEFVREESITCGKARSALDEAGHRNRAVESATRGCEITPAAGECEGVDQAQRGVRTPRRQQAQATVAAAISGGPDGAETRRPGGGVAKGIGPPGQSGRPPTAGCRS